MPVRIEVSVKRDLADPEGTRIRQAFSGAGLPVSSARSYRAYLFETPLSAPDAERLARDLLSDPVLDDHAVDAPLPAPAASSRRIEILRRPGVMDPVEGSLRRAARDLGLEIGQVKCVRGAWVDAIATGEELRRAAYKAVANPVVDEVRVDERAERYAWRFAVQTQAVARVAIRGASAEALERISRESGYALTRAEMLAIQARYAALGRDPTDVELETFAQTWSEHCSHKTFRGSVETESGRIDNLLKSTVFRATKDLAREWCVSVFEDNAGVIELDGDQCLAFKVETHNHPSAIEPYGGSGTGVGGVIRDILGVGLGAKPILNLDVFCVGPLDLPEKDLPKGALHPRRILGGLVAGVRDYGNRMGIPTPSGGLLSHPGFTANPLVFCGTLGLLPRSAVRKEPRAGDWVVAVGGRTGRDGIHGATFSSETLHEESETVSIGAVQIGDPITEKRMMDALLAARDAGLYTAVTDCGAGGFSSAVGEMAKGLGAEVDLERAPLKYAGLSYREVWISESQERMVLSVPPEKWEALRALFERHGSEAAVIGRFTSDGRLKLRWQGAVVGDLDLAFLHDGCPRVASKASPPPARAAERPPGPVAPGIALRRMLADVSVASKEWIVRQYDHEVQARTFGKPFVGPLAIGPADAVVIAPLRDRPIGAAVGLGLSVRFGEDPYRMAASAIDEALRNVVAVGGDPARTAILDNFCWGDVRDPVQMHHLVRASEGCRDASSALGTPFISGKDSLNNTYEARGQGSGDRGQRVSIPPTLLISALSIVPDTAKTVSMDLKAAGDALYLVGLTRRELGGSLYYALCGGAGGEIPAADPSAARRTFEAMHMAILKGLLRACHDLSEGGLAVALAEMAIASRLGAEADLALAAVAPGAASDADLLFSESNSRFLAEVAPADEGGFEMLLATAKVPCQRIGRVTAEPRLRIQGVRGAPAIDEGVDPLRAIWTGALPRLMEGRSSSS